MSGKRMSFHFPSLAIVMIITVVGGRAVLEQSFEGKGSSVAGLALGWVGWVGKGVSVSCMGVQLLCKGVQLCNPPKIRSTIVASLRLFY
jgi:hypothetical protein